MTQVQILWVGRFYKSTGDGIRSHNHPFYHMIFVHSGQLTMTAGKNTFPMEAGQCILIPQGMDHAYSNPGKETMEGLEIKFSIPSEPLDRQYATGGALVSSNSLVQMLFEQIVQEYSDLGSLADDAATSYMGALLNALTMDSRYHKRRDFQFIDASVYSELSQQIIQYLEKHYAESVSLYDVAEAVGYNKSYMCTSFRKNTQITINDCLNMIRIRRAAELIAYSDNDLSQIAAMCGFSTVSHFNQVFLKYVGTTPGQCRKAFPVGINIMPERRFMEIPNRQERFMYNVLAQKMITPEMILAFEKDGQDRD